MGNEKIGNEEELEEREMMNVFVEMLGALE